MAMKSAWSGLHNMNADGGAKAIQANPNAKVVHRQAGFLGATLVSDRMRTEGSVHNGSQKFSDNEAKQVSQKKSAKERLGLQERRVALEQDVRQLRNRLSKEINIRKVLERAFDRPIGFLPRLPNYLLPKTQELIAEVAVLEEEVVALEDQVFSLQQELEVEPYNNADLIEQIHRSSVCPATWINNPPSHRLPEKKLPSPAKKDVIIAQLLNSVPAPSPIKSSDAQIKDRNLNKHSAASSPRIAAKSREPSTSPRIHAASSPRLMSPNSKDSSACGGVSALRQPECGKQNQLRPIGTFSSYWPQALKAKASIANSPTFHQPPTLKVKHSAPSSCGMLNFKIGAEFRNSPEPNKLSEEMMKCLLSIYCTMTKPCLMSEYDTCSTVSSSTFSSFNSQMHGSKSTLSTKTRSEIPFESDQSDPYSVCGEFPRDIGPYKNLQNIVAKSFDYRRIQDSASMLRRLRVMVDTLGTLDLRGMSHQQKLAFWINIYNVCMMHGFLEYGIPGSPHQVMALMHKAMLNVGGYSVNALAIEHSILRLPAHSKHPDFADIRSKDNASMQTALGLEWPEPLVSFALCCGSQSSPAVRVYTASKIENELEIAKKEYLQAAIGITKRNKVLIPKLLDWNSCNFAKDTESFMDWICKQIPIPLQKAVQECMLKAKGALSRALEVMPYNFNFRYLLVAL